MEGFTSRQEEIIKESLKLISTGGIQELTFRNLSKQMGISEPAFYRHFPGKTEILLGILEYFEQIRDGMAAEVRTLRGDGLRKIEQMIGRHLEMFASNPSLLTILFPDELPQADTRVTDRALRIMAGTEASLRDIIEEGSRSGEIRSDIPADELCLLILGALRLLVTRWRLDRGSVDLKTEGQRLVAACLALTRPAAGGAAKGEKA